MAEAILNDAKSKMDKALEVMLDEFKGVRTGRATPGLVENIRVDYYGNPSPIKNIAGISVPDPRQVVIKPFDPSSLAEIEKAIQKADIGVNPQNDGKLIRLNIPPLSEDRRKQMAGMVKDISEKAKVSVRNIRRDANKSIDQQQKDSTITEDDKFKAREDIQKMTDHHEKQIDDLSDKKTQEIMEV